MQAEPAKNEPSWDSLARSGDFLAIGEVIGAQAISHKASTGLQGNRNFSNLGAVATHYPQKTKVSSSFL